MGSMNFGSAICIEPGDSLLCVESCGWSRAIANLINCEAIGRDLNVLVYE